MYFSPSLNPLQYKMNSTYKQCFARYISHFWRVKYERKSYFNWMVDLQVWPCSQLICLSKIWLLVIYLNFQSQKPFKIQYLPHPNFISYKIDLIKSCPLISFQQHQSYIPISLKILILDLVLFSMRNHSIFKNFYIASPNAMKPS
jgi:hypothetical protein